MANFGIHVFILHIFIKGPLCARHQFLISIFMKKVSFDVCHLLPILWNTSHRSLCLQEENTDRFPGAPPPVPRVSFFPIQKKY